MAAFRAPVCFISSGLIFYRQRNCTLQYYFQCVGNQSFSHRGLGWRIHGSVEDTKLSTNKQHSLLSHSAPLVCGACVHPVVSPCFLCLVTFVVGGLDRLNPGLRDLVLGFICPLAF